MMRLQPHGFRGPRRIESPFVRHKRAAGRARAWVRTPPTGDGGEEREGFAIPHVLGQDEPFVLPKDLRRMSGPSRHGAGLVDVVVPRTRFARNHSAGGRSTQLI